MKEVTDAEFDAEVLKASGLALIDFHAPWCGPCRMLGPVLAELATEFGGKIKIVKMNIDESPETPSQYGVRAIPCMILFKNGNEVDRKVGMSSKSQLKNWIDIQLAEKFEPTYPVFENPGVEDGILKKDDLYIVFIRGEERDSKQEGVCKTQEEAVEVYKAARVKYYGDDSSIPSVYEMREVTETKLVKIS